MKDTKNRDLKIVMAIFIALAIAIIFNMRCKSIPIQEKEAKQIAEIDSVEQIIKSSDLSPEAKANSIRTLESSKIMIRDQGQIITKQEDKIESLKWYEHLVWIVGSVLALLIGFVIYKKVKSSIIPGL